MSFVASDFSLGRQRRRQWASLITQQLRLRHVDQIFAYNLPDKKSNYYFTLHKTCMSCPFYTSEKVQGKHPKWNELILRDLETNYSSVVVRLWKSMKQEEEMVVTWGVNFSGLVYLGSKIADVHPRYFKANTVIFCMQGGYFTSQNYIKTDLEKALPFRHYLNLVEKDNNELVLYRRIAIKSPKGEIQSTYNLEKLRQLQELQRLIKNKNIDVENIKEKIHKVTETDRQSHSNDSSTSSYGNNVRFAPQLLTMNSLNKMLHGKPTKSEREQMGRISKQIEETKFRIRLLSKERDKLKGSLRKLKQRESSLSEENDEKNSNLMALYHALNKDMERLKQYRHSFYHHKENFIHTSRQLYLRQKQLLKELLFIYPIEKIPNENKYTMLGIYLPNSEILTDCSDPGVSVVLGHICHILIMCSIFLQVPLRYPMRHLGSRSVIYDQVSGLIPDKDREFPLYTKDKDKAHFGYAVFLLNKNLSQLRWYFYRWYTLDLKETLKHLYHFLLGNETNDLQLGTTVYDESLRRLREQCPADDRALCGSSNGAPNPETLDKPPVDILALDKLVSLSISSTSSSNLNDPLLEADEVNYSVLKEIKQEKVTSLQSPVKKSPKRKLGLFKATSKHVQKEDSSKGSSEVLALPEAYLNKQISKDLFDRCASGKYIFSEKCTNLSKAESNSSVDHFNDIKVKCGIEEFKADVCSSMPDYSDVIEQGTDPLDPSTNLDALITKSITIKPEPTNKQNLKFSLHNKRISRSAGSYVDEEMNNFIKTSFELGSDPLINIRCDKTTASSSSSSDIPLESNQTLNTPILGKSGFVPPNNTVSSEDIHNSFQNNSCPLTARTDRLMFANQSFNLVKHRATESE